MEWHNNRTLQEHWNLHAFHQQRHWQCFAYILRPLNTVTSKKWPSHLSSLVWRYRLTGQLKKVQPLINKIRVCLRPLSSKAELNLILDSCSWIGATQEPVKRVHLRVGVDAAKRDKVLSKPKQRCSTKSYFPRLLLLPENRFSCRLQNELEFPPTLWRKGAEEINKYSCLSFQRSKLTKYDRNHGQSAVIFAYGWVEEY